MTDIPFDEAGARLTVDLAALAANYRLLAARAAGAECAAVVKADAYGLGLAAVAPALAAAGARTFFVAHAFEARRLRALLPGATVYVLNGLAPGAAPRLAEIDARPVLCTGEDIAEWAAFCRAAGRRLPTAIQIDTGMNRLGIALDEARALAGDAAGPLAAFEHALVMSHFVSAEDTGSPLNAAQAAAFAAVREIFSGVPASLANSSGIFLAARPLHDLVRPGYALYGGNPTPGTANPMHPVVSLAARVLQVRTVEAGATVGYNAQWTAPGQRRLAALSIGYADGFPRAAAGLDGRPGGHAVFAGAHCPIVGRVSMDILVIDVTGCAAPPRRGDLVELLGPHIGVDELARAAGTIGYDILTRLGGRFARRYASGANGGGAGEYGRGP